jgi:hypothetical protein
MKLWVDDYRDAPDESWTVARKVNDAIRLLALYDAVEISLDHDIENRPDNETFMPVAYFLGQKFAHRYDQTLYGMKGEVWSPKVTIHTDNPVAAKEMRSVLGDYGLVADVNPYTSNEDFYKKYGL